MKFEMWSCPECNYKLITASKNPTCPDCDVAMDIVTNNEQREIVDKNMKQYLESWSDAAANDCEILMIGMEENHE